MLDRKHKGHHGMCGTRLYDIWRDMRHRCYIETNCNYQYYGGRGIKVCTEWFLDFNKFYLWAMSNGYKSNLTLDRINNDGDYEPSNCRWATKSVQNMNRRSFSNKSGYIGVHRNSGDSHWVAMLKVNGKSKYIGMSKDLTEAVIMRNNYIDEHNLPNKKNEVIS